MRGRQVNSEPWEIAHAAQRPISDTPRQPLEVERLLSESQRRRITVSDHERFRETFDNPHRDDADIADLLDELRRGKANP